MSAYLTENVGVLLIAVVFAVGVIAGRAMVP